MPRAFTLLMAGSLAAIALPAGARETPDGERVVIRTAFADDDTRALQRSLFRTGGSRLSPSIEEDRPRSTRSVVVPPPRLIPRPPAWTSTPAARELALQPTAFTPYDRYLGTVRSVIAQLDEREPGMVLACDLMREGRRFRYIATDPYRADPPALTEARRAGDCKAKALWLYQRLGDPTALYVIGKLQRGARTSHAWIYWRSQGRWWILDPTDRNAPIAADSVAPSRYVPYYSYGKAGAYRHPATQLMASTFRGTTPAVAGQSAPTSAANLVTTRRVIRR